MSAKYPRTTLLYSEAAGTEGRDTSGTADTARQKPDLNLCLFKLQMTKPAVQVGEQSLPPTPPPPFRLTWHPHARFLNHWFHWRRFSVVLEFPLLFKYVYSSINLIVIASDETMSDVNISCVGLAHQTSHNVYEMLWHNVWVLGDVLL